MEFSDHHSHSDDVKEEHQSHSSYDQKEKKAEEPPKNRKRQKGIAKNISSRK